MQYKLEMRKWAKTMYVNGWVLGLWVMQSSFNEKANIRSVEIQQHSYIKSHLNFWTSSTFSSICSFLSPVLLHVLDRLFKPWVSSVCVWEREMLVWGMYLHQDQYSGLLKLFTFFLLKKGVCNLTFRITHSHTSWEHKLMSWWYWCLSPWLLTIGCYRYNTTRILYLCTISVGPDHRARADMKIGKITTHTTCMNSKSYNLTLWITASESFHTETWK